MKAVRSDQKKVYQSGLGVRPRGESREPRWYGKHRAVVINTYATDEDQNPSSYQVRCDIILARSMIPLANVPVMSPAGVNDARPWSPTPTTGTFSGEPLNLRTFSKRGTFEGNPTPFSDINGDHVVIEFIEGNPNFPMIVGKMPHEFTKRAVVDGGGWSNDTQDAQRGVPEKQELYARHWGTEFRVNATGDVLIDTVGATQDLDNEIPAPTGGEVRVRLKRGQELVVAGGSVAGAGELGGSDLLGVKQNEDESVETRMGDDEFTITKTLIGDIQIKLSDQVSISIGELGDVEVNVGGIQYLAPAAGPALINMNTATASFVKGEALVAALNSFITALNVYSAAVAASLSTITPGAPSGGAPAATALTAAATALGTALTTVSTALTASLSQTIKGE